jgi:hypothetical protein
MSEICTHADNIDLRETDLFEEITYGTITVLYKDLSYYQYLFGYERKKTKNIVFCFDSCKYILEKKSISKLKYFKFSQFDSLSCPSIIKNKKNDRIFIKVAPSIKQENNTMKLNYFLTNIKILKGHPSIPNIKYSIHNCIYRLHNLRLKHSVVNIIELACIYTDEYTSRFIFAYNNIEIKKEEISYILKKILCNNC